MFEGKNILITGGTGTLGHELVKRLLPHRPRNIVVYSRGEIKQVAMKAVFPHLTYRLGAVENRSSLERALIGAETVFHLAASKHADLAEKDPFQAVMSNVIGSMNVVELSIKYGVEQVVGISTDKAVEPNNVYGMTKKLMERLFMTTNRHGLPTKFFITRFGNIFGSAGSVVEKWHQDSMDGKKLRVSNPEMARFFFSVGDAVDLIFEALTDGDCECVYSTRMPALLISDLADVMQTVGVEVMGNRGGEKVHECLITTDEMKRTVALRVAKADDGRPFEIFKIGTEDIFPLRSHPYTTETADRMSAEQIRALLVEYLKAA